jgi:hypothetical protein
MLINFTGIRRRIKPDYHPIFPSQKIQLPPCFFIVNGGGGKNG